MTLEEPLQCRQWCYEDVKYVIGLAGNNGGTIFLFISTQGELRLFLKKKIWHYWLTLISRGELCGGAGVWQTSYKLLTKEYWVWPEPLLRWRVLIDHRVHSSFLRARVLMDGCACSCRKILEDMVPRLPDILVTSTQHTYLRPGGRLEWPLSLNQAEGSIIRVT